MPDELWGALGALLVAVLNELRASVRARAADRDRSELWRPREPVRTCDGVSCSPGGRDHGGCGCGEPAD